MIYDIVLDYTTRGGALAVRVVYGVCVVFGIRHRLNGYLA